MSKKIVQALSTGEEFYLQGSLTLPHSSENRATVVVVIVDDNSGSMGGSRASQCVEKTKVIVKRCEEARVPYQYAT
jgi:hypothetical protein